MLVFKKIKWKNFLSTGNIFTEIGFDVPGTTLIVGENGAGKSTILDALTFSLFGKTFRNINKPQLVNSINRKELIVELEFAIQSNNYKIIRGIKPNVFEVYCNENLLNQSAEMKDYQEVLEKTIIKINYKSFCQVVILGSASFVPFMELPAAQRRGIIEDLLDLQVFTTMNVLLKQKVQDNASSIQDNENERKIVDTKIKMVKEHLNAVRSKNQEFVKEKKVALDDLEKKIKEARDAKESYRTELVAKSTELQNRGTIETKVEKLKLLRAQMEAKNKILTKEIEFFNNHDNCPTCSQAISSEFSCIVVDQRQNEIKAVEDGLEQLVKKYDATNLELTKILEVDKACDQINSKISHESLKIRMIQEQIDNVAKDLADAKKAVKDTSDVRIADLENDLSDLSSRYNALQDDKYVLSAAALLLKDGGIKTRIVNQYIPVINKLINKYLSEFDLFVEFNLDEQFNEVIKSRYRDEFSYASFSEGEKSRINLAILFAWRAIAKMRNSLNTNLLILDEVFDGSLDSDSSDNLHKVLGQLSQDSNVLVISHRDNLQDKFPNTLRFVKRKSFSSIAS